MNRFYAALLGGLSTLLLVSCGSSPSTPQAAAPASAPPASPAAAKPTAAGFMALQKVINQTKTAVEAGNFEQAQVAFDKFEPAWKTVEDGVKAKSSATYEAIEDGMDAVNKGIKGKSKEQVLEALKTIAKSLAIAAQS